MRLRKLILLLVFLIATVFSINAQIAQKSILNNQVLEYSVNSSVEAGGETCEEAAPLTTSDGQYTYPCGTSGYSAESGPDYGCLDRQDNPAWYTMHIQKGGRIEMDLSADSDIDFIIWGPFDGECGDAVCDYDLLDADHIIDCGYGSSSEETPIIPNAVEGAIYMFLITQNTATTQDFTLKQTNVGDAGAGASDAGCLGCFLVYSSMNLTVGDCEPHQEDGNYYSEYDLSGSVNIKDNTDPSLDSISWILDDVKFNTAETPLPSSANFVLNNLPSDGATHTITVILYSHEGTDVDSCYFSMDYVAPENCADCAANAGEDIESCGDILTMAGSIDADDYNTYWKTLCSDVNFTDSTNAKTTVSYSGEYTNGAPIVCEAVWTITNSLGLTCSDTAKITFKPIPSADFYLTSEVCKGLTDTAILKNVENIPISTYDWVFSNASEETGSANDTIVLRHRNVGQNEVCLTITSDLGCVSSQVCHSANLFQTLSSDFTVSNSVCGECNGEINSNYPSDKFYIVRWATNSEFNNSTDLMVPQGETMRMNQLCEGQYYLQFIYQTALNYTCRDTLSFELNVDSSTISETRFEFLVDTTDLQVPFSLNIETINNTSVNADSYVWQIFNGRSDDLSMLIWEGNTLIPDYKFENMGEYYIKLQAFSDKAPNCSSNPADATLFIHYKSVIEVPNIFTPNNDGYNDEFRIKARELETYRCVIYNRWGEKVFETEDSDENWNGKKMNEGGNLSSGTYYYVIDGTGKQGESFKFKGAVELLRDK